MVTAPERSNRTRSNRSPSILVVDLNLRTPSVLQVGEVALNIPVHLLVVRVGVEQVRVLRIVEAVGKVNSAVAEVLVVVCLALAERAGVALAAKGKRHDGMVMLESSHGEVHARVVVVEHVEDGPHGTARKLHAANLGVVVRDPSVQSHGHLVKLTELGLCFEDNIVALPANGDTVLSKPVVDGFDGRGTVLGRADESSSRRNRTPDTGCGIASALSEGLAAGGQSIECKDLVRHPESSTKEPRDSSFRHSVSMVLVLVNLLLEVENKVPLLAQLDGEVHKRNECSSHEDYEKKHHPDGLLQAAVVLCEKTPCRCGLAVTQQMLLGATVGFVLLLHSGQVIFEWRSFV